MGPTGLHGNCSQLSIWGSGKDAQLSQRIQRLAARRPQLSTSSCTTNTQTLGYGSYPKGFRLPVPSTSHVQG